MFFFLIKGEIKGNDQGTRMNCKRFFFFFFFKSGNIKNIYIVKWTREVKYMWKKGQVFKNFFRINELKMLN